MSIINSASKSPQLTLQPSQELSTSTGPCCWICFDGEDASKGDLVAPCRCSRQAQRLAHSRCLARWQLQSAGTKRERFCDFCGDALPDWRAAQGMTAAGAKAPAIMNVNFGGSTYSFQVRPGPEGYREFTQAICRAFALPQDAELNITFTCDEPSSGSLLTLQGAGAYDAAVHCAAVSAAKRLPRHTLHQPHSPATPSSSRRNCSASSLPSLPGSPGGSSGGSVRSSPVSSPRRESPASDSEDAGPAGAAGGKGLTGLRQRIRSVFSELF